MPKSNQRSEPNLRGSWGSPDRALWTAVLNQALRDAVGRWSGSDRNVGNTVDGWVGSADFVTVCHLAGADPSKMQATFLRLIEEKNFEDAE